MSEVRIVYDVELRRPACALLQAALGGTLGVSSHFPSRLWLDHPTDGMRLLRGTREELAMLVEQTIREEAKDDG